MGEFDPTGPQKECIMNKKYLSKQHTTVHMGTTSDPIHLLDIRGLCEIAEIVCRLMQNVSDVGEEDGERVDSESKKALKQHTRLSHRRR